MSDEKKYVVVSSKGRVTKNLDEASAKEELARLQKLQEGQGQGASELQLKQVLQD